jgi:hypothetical protein
MARPHDAAGTTYRYEVIQRNWLVYLVQEVQTVRATAAPAMEFRSTVRWFLKLDKAEECAKGLAEGTWTQEGPIMASFESHEEETDVMAL